MSARVTIKDVARAAGVAVGTVSNHLNASARVAPATARRIERAIERLDYRVHLGARSLRSQRTQSVGLVLPNISNPFYAEVARAIEHALWARGFQTMLCDSAGDPGIERRHIETLAERRVDGLLVIRADAGRNADGLLDAVDCPVVFVDRGVPGRPTVTSDNRAGGELAARHLADLGHERIAVLQGENRVGNVRERMRGFREALRRRGLTLDPARVRSGPQAVELGYQVEPLMTLRPRPTAVFATNDIVALGAWRRLLELGVRVPEDVSLIGFDDIVMAGLLSPPLTTVAQDKDALGRRAAEVLLARLNGESPPQESVIPTRLVVRASTARVPAAGAASPGARRGQER